ncbi:MAG: TetR/AcrR family transcriptional regulator [Solirubrobacterales bacterium]
MASVTRKTQSSRVERRQELLEQLLGVVEGLFADGETFTELSVERLVSEAGISRSTFYVYFEDKGELLNAWLEQIIDEVAESTGPWYGLTAEATRDDLRVALAQLIESYQPHTQLMAAVLDATTYDPSVRAGVEQIMRRNVAGLRHHICAGQRDGFIDPALPAKETAEWLTWMAERGFHQLIRTAVERELELLTDSYTDIVWSTLYAPVLDGGEAGSVAPRKNALPRR